MIITPIVGIIKKRRRGIRAYSMRGPPLFWIVLTTRRFVHHQVIAFGTLGSCSKFL